MLWQCTAGALLLLLETAKALATSALEELCDDEDDEEDEDSEEEADDDDDDDDDEEEDETGSCSWSLSRSGPGTLSSVQSRNCHGLGAWGEVTPGHKRGDRGKGNKQGLAELIGRVGVVLRKGLGTREGEPG